MITRERIADVVDGYDGYISATVTWPCALVVDSKRWIHATTGAFMIAFVSDEECDELPSKGHEDRRKHLRKWLSEVPIHCVCIKLDDLRAWHGEPNGSDQAMHRTSIGWIDGYPFNRYLVKHALALIETPLVLAWWAEPGGPLMFADAENTWRVAVMPMTNDYFGKPWPTADRPRLVLRASWDRSKVSCR